LNAIVRTYGLKYAGIGIWKLLWGGSLWFGVYYLLSEIMQLKTKSAVLDKQVIAILFLISSLLCTIFIQQLMAQSFNVGIQVRAGLMGIVYSKSLNLSRLKGGAGDVVNLVANDCNKISEAAINFHYLWSATFEVTAVMILAILQIGTSALPALGILAILIPIQIYLGHLRSKLGTEATQHTSKRVHVMSEILTAIKLIKFYAWEAPFASHISEIRAKEMSLIKKSFYLNAISFSTVFAAPVIIALIVLLTAWKLDGTGGSKELNARSAFVVIALFNTLRYPFLMLPLAVNSVSDARIAFSRIDKFLEQPEVEKTVRLPAAQDGEDAILMKEANFSWDKDVSLKSISFNAKKGQLIAVVGDVGSGKSSLIAALLRQMNQQGGVNEVHGKISYVPQEAWLLNMTFRDNVLFGSAYDMKRYNEVIRVCALRRDLELMENGDVTEIGERGVNLSGGQRQRISLARAVYNNGDVIFLDDPLSAVDQHVGKHIFNECISGFLQGSTRVFVTHQLQYLPQCDYILVMSKGSIVEQGTYSELIAKAGHLSTLVGSSSSYEEEELEDPINSEVPVKSHEIHVAAPNAIEMKSLSTSDLTQQQIMERNQFSIDHHVAVSDENISKIIEKSQSSILKDDYTHQADVAKAVEKNALTVHSTVDVPIEDLSLKKLV
jgi:ABC-type multidrug transport system fused ATPase/permease subunit